VLSTSGAVAKLLALQVFCLVVILSRLLSSALLQRQLPALKIILGVKLALLIANAALTIHFGPFSNGDDVPAVLTGMVLIAAMAIQNAAHRIHLGSALPSTLMTGTTTQIMIDLTDMLQPPRPKPACPDSGLRIWTQLGFYRCRASMRPTYRAGLGFGA
jgi:uncharacterized membrane protein YoaK (UPF0700 family)